MLRQKKMKKNIVALLLAAALLISMVGMASASIQWDLDSGTPLIMYKETAHTESGSVFIPDGASKVWRANYSAEPASGVYFPPNQWQGRLTTGVNLTGMYTVDIGYSDSDGSGFVSNGNTGTQSSYNEVMGASNSIIAAAGFTVPQGKYLALNVTASGASFTVTTDGSSYVMWPKVDPAYPVPELSTIILMSAGLLALMGYVVYSRRRKEQ